MKLLAAFYLLLRRQENSKCTKRNLGKSKNK